MKPASWVPDSPKAAEDELHQLVGAASRSMVALERAWRLAILITPTLMRWWPKPSVAPPGGEPHVSDLAVGPTIDIIGRDLARELLGPTADDDQLATVGIVIENGNLLLPARLDPNKKKPAEATGYMTSGLAPYLYECCRVVLGTNSLTGRIWALSEYAFNPHAEAPASAEFWALAVQSWRKHYMKGGAEGHRDRRGYYIKHENNITVAGLRVRLENDLKQSRQGKQR